PGSAPRVSESPASAGGVGKRVHFHEFHPLVARDHELGDAIAAADLEGLLSEVDEDDADLAAVVAVDGAGCVDHADAVAQRQPRAGPDLRFVARRQLDGHAGGNEGPLAGFEPQVHVRAQVEAGAALGGMGRQGEGLPPLAHAPHPDPDHFASVGAPLPLSVGAPAPAATPLPLSRKASLRERRILPWRSMETTLTSTSSPSCSTSETFLTRWSESSEMCTRPSVPGKISTKAPNSTMRRTVEFGAFVEIFPGT